MMQQGSDKGNEIATLLLAGAQDASHDRVSPCAGFGPIAAIGLANDDGWTDFAFGLIVGWVNGPHIQKGKQPIPLLAEQFCKAHVVGVRQLLVQHSIHCSFDAPTSHGIAVF